MPRFFEGIKKISRPISHGNYAEFDTVPSRHFSDETRDAIERGVMREDEGLKEIGLEHVWSNSVKLDIRVTRGYTVLTGYLPENIDIARIRNLLAAKVDHPDLKGHAVDLHYKPVSRIFWITVGGNPAFHDHYHALSRDWEAKTS